MARKKACKVSTLKTMILLVYTNSANLILNCILNLKAIRLTPLDFRCANQKQKLKTM